VIKKIRSKHSAAPLPIIVISERTEQVLMVECLPAGANDQVTKPLGF